MKNQSLKFLFIPSLVFLLNNLSSAAVYSIVTNWAKVEGTENCYKIDYALMESHDDTNQLNDTHLGTFSTIVGSDCVSGFMQPVEAMANVDANNAEPAHSFECYPNPANSNVTIRYNNPDVLSKMWSWTLVTANNAIVMKGKTELVNKSEFNVNTSTLPSGMYKLILVNDSQFVSILPVSIIN